MPDLTAVQKVCLAMGWPMVTEREIAAYRQGRLDGAAEQRKDIADSAAQYGLADAWLRFIRGHKGIKAL